MGLWRSAIEGAGEGDEKDGCGEEGCAELKHGLCYGRNGKRSSGTGLAFWTTGEKVSERKSRAE